MQLTNNIYDWIFVLLSPLLNVKWVTWHWCLDFLFLSVLTLSLRSLIQIEMCLPKVQAQWVKLPTLFPAAPETPSQECVYSPHPALSTSESSLLLLPFPKISFDAISKLLYIPPLWKLLRSPLLWKQPFLPDLSILYLNFSYSVYLFMPFVMIFKTYFFMLYNQTNV